MYAIRASKLNSKIRNYLKNQRISSISFDVEEKAYYCDKGKRGGLLKALKAMYYPGYQRIGKKKTKKKKVRVRRASSKLQGQIVDNEITRYVATGKRPIDAYANAVVDYLENRMKHCIEAAQLPLFVQVGKQEKITQADVITSDSKGNLWMWEIKSGYNQAQSQGFLKIIKERVGSKDHNHWELQRHYTHQGLVHSGLPIYRSHVLNVFIDGAGITIQRRSVPKWTKAIRVNPGV